VNVKKPHEIIIKILISAKLPDPIHETGFPKLGFITLLCTKVIMQGKLFQRCAHLLYCSVLSLGGNVNTRRIMWKPVIGSIFNIKKSMKYSGHRKLLCELSKLSKFNVFNLLGY